VFVITLKVALKALVRKHSSRKHSCEALVLCRDSIVMSPL